MLERTGINQAGITVAREEAWLSAWATTVLAEAQGWVCKFRLSREVGVWHNVGGG